MKKFQKLEQEISSILNNIKWKFTNGTYNKLLAALFDLSGHNLALRTPFNRRSWVTQWRKIFKKVRVCVFLTDKSNQATFLEKINLSSVKTARKTGYFLFFTWLTTWLIVATIFFSIIWSVFIPGTHICAFFCSITSYSRLIAKKHSNL